MTVTLLLTIACPAVGIFTGYFCLTDRNFDWKSAALCLALFMGALSYGYEPTDGSDLVRYVEYVESTKDASLGELMTGEGYGEDGLYLFVIVSWLVGKLGDPQLLPVISTFIVYYIGLYITGKLGEDLNVEPAYIAAYMFFIVLCSNYYSISNNIRNILGFVMIGYGVFREVYEKKKDLLTLFMYVGPIFIHTSAVVILLCRFMVPLIGRHKALGLALSAAVEPIVNILFEITWGMSGGNFIIDNIKKTVYKAYMYFHDSSSSWGTIAQASGSRRVWKIVYVAVVVIMCILAVYVSGYLIRKLKRNLRDTQTKRLIFMVDFAFVIGVMTIACTPMYMPEYWRFAATMIIMGAPIYFCAATLRKEGTGDAVTDLVLDVSIKALFGLMAVCCLLWIRQLTNSNLLLLITRPFACSPVVVFSRFLFEKIWFYL